MKVHNEASRKYQKIKTRICNFSRKVEATLREFTSPGSSGPQRESTDARSPRRISRPCPTLRRPKSSVSGRVHRHRFPALHVNILISSGSPSRPDSDWGAVSLQDRRRRQPELHLELVGPPGGALVVHKLRTGRCRRLLYVQLIPELLTEAESSFGMDCRW